MTNVLSAFSTFSQPVALTAGLVYLFGQLTRQQLSMAVNQMLAGVLLAFGVVATMATPIEMGDGFMIDLRNLLVAMSFAFFGLRGGLITAGTAIGLRLFIGGDGTSLGIMGIAVSAAMGYLWHLTCWHYQRTNWRWLVLLGLMTSVHLVIGLLLPPSIRAGFFAQMAPALLACNLIGALVLGAMIIREQAHMAELIALTEAANTDPLTKLLNRRSATAAADRLPRPASTNGGRVLLYFDIDHFKQINDTHGHLVGDRVLKIVAERIQKCLRPQDIFSRLGGDEFMIVLPNISQESATIVARRCVDAIADQPFILPDVTVRVSISLGASWSATDGQIDDLISEADEALYLAKASGRNQYALHDSFDGPRLVA